MGKWRVVLPQCRCPTKSMYVCTVRVQTRQSKGVMLCVCVCMSMHVFSRARENTCTYVCTVHLFKGVYIHVILSGQVHGEKPRVNTERRKAILWRTARSAALSAKGAKGIYDKRRQKGLAVPDMPPAAYAPPRAHLSPFQPHPGNAPLSLCGSSHRLQPPGAGKDEKRGRRPACSRPHVVSQHRLDGNCQMVKTRPGRILLDVWVM